MVGPADHRQEAAGPGRGTPPRSPRRPPAPARAGGSALSSLDRGAEAPARGDPSDRLADLGDDPVAGLGVDVADVDLQRHPRGDAVDRPGLDPADARRGDGVGAARCRAPRPRRRGRPRPRRRGRRGGRASGPSPRGPPRRRASTRSDAGAAIAVDDADRQPLALEERPLLDVQLDERRVTARPAAGRASSGPAKPAREPDLVERPAVAVPQRRQRARRRAPRPAPGCRGSRRRTASAPRS